MALGVNLKRLKHNIQELASFGRTSRGGITRIAFSPDYQRSCMWLKGKMEEAGLETRIDPAGNLFGTLELGDDVIMLGSHLDTVPEGGQFDGALGVLAALECLQIISERSLPVRCSLEIAAFNDEEGAFCSFLGSRAMTGVLNQVDVESMYAFGGITLCEAMKECGLNARDLGKAERDLSRAKAYLELHIEQGPYLDSLNIPIGIVEAIVGIMHYRMVFTGESDHAGTTPMKIRRDAFLGSAEFTVRAREWVIESCLHSVLNVGHVEVLPGAFNIVPSESRLAVEFRDVSTEALLELERALIRIGTDVAQKHGLKFIPICVSATQPVSLSPRVKGVLKENAEDLGLNYTMMTSGAGHDAQVMARKVDTGMILVPSLGGKSHCLEEGTRWADIAKGTTLLLAALLDLSSE